MDNIPYLRFKVVPKWIIWNNKPRKILCEYPQIRPKTTKNVIAVTKNY